ACRRNESGRTATLHPEGICKLRTVAARTRKRFAWSDRPVASQRQKQNNLQRHDPNGSGLSEQYVAPSGSENHVQNCRYNCARSRRITADVDAEPAAPKCVTERVGSTQESSQTKSMKKPIRVGVLGCGYWGPLLIRNFRSLSECRLKVVCDLDIARLKHA